MKSPSLTAILESLPIDAAVRIELVGGVPVFRAPPKVRAQIDDLLEQRELRPLDPSELHLLTQYEELDDFLSLVNRLVRNEALGLDEDAKRVTAA